jgi:hypothetical protein
MSANDGVATIAENLARNCGYAVFPCREDKSPACPHGFKVASRDPDVISELWRRYLGPLIGTAAGEASSIDVLDVDIKHTAALAWWRSNEVRIPATRTFRTRSGGLHLYHRHATGLGGSAGKLAPGIDVRGDGGYVISWFAAGCECLDHSPPAPWPGRLVAELLPKPKPPVAVLPRVKTNVHADLAIEGVLRLIATAAEGERNSVLHWSACRLGERVRAGQIGQREAEALLVAAAAAAGLAEREARATARSGLRRVAS